jgi:hypothetical protein
MLATVIKAPPERNRTRSPSWNEALAWACIAVLDDAGSETAVTDRGIPRAVPSITAIAIEARFLNRNMILTPLLVIRHRMTFHQRH